MKKTDKLLEKIIALCKRRGFVFPSADIYNGLNGVYDFGPLGTLMKHNIKQAWMKHIQSHEETILFFDGSILGPSRLWEASGHVEHFHDPMIDCLECKKRYRTDEIDSSKPCPSCGKKAWTEARTFNMMFSTNVGAAEDRSTLAYLRPETAQSIFGNFKNILSSSRLKIPFGIAQIGKAFRNEITPKQFLFRMREFEQAELEFFCKEETADQFFSSWTQRRFDFYSTIGITQDRLRIRPHAADELAHYSSQCNDIEYHFPFGWKELEGIAHRGNYDLTQHSRCSGKDLSMYDEQTQSSFIPTIIESSVGIERLFLTLLFDAYEEDSLQGEPRILLKLHPTIAPIKAAFLPLSKQLSQQCYNLFIKSKKQGFFVHYDDTGSIGKRYRRQDEIGTPFCFTYDFESNQDNKVTVRYRDDARQERIPFDELPHFLTQHLI
ncbi:MAG: glycine--tRNA ligase [Candidatus Babeliales bacterium]